MSVTYPVLKSNDCSLKRTIVHQMQRSLYLSGLAWAYSKRVDPEGALIIMYHSVVDDTNAPFLDHNYSISVKTFESQVRYLKHHGNIISLSEMMECIYGGKSLPENAVVLTFDDGYLNNLTHAAPILEKYDVPAMIYLCTGYVDRRQSQWDDLLYTAFQHRTQHSLSWKGENFDLMDAARLHEAFGAVAGLLIISDITTRDEILSDVTAQLQPRQEAPQLTMGWDDVRELKSRYPNIELGLHTVDHLDMTSLPTGDLEQEIARSREMFRQELGYDAEHYSYPYGRHSETVAELLKQMGLKSAVITQPTALVTKKTDPFMMPRYEITSSLLDLKLWMSGAFPDLSQKLMARVYD